MDINNFGSATGLTPREQRNAYASPQLTLLGDVVNLTETGSAVGWESPLNLCVFTNSNYNSCRG